MVYGFDIELRRFGMIANEITLHRWPKGEVSNYWSQYSIQQWAKPIPHRKHNVY